MIKLLIIGSKGFIGSHCHSYFSKLTDFNVYGADVITEYNESTYFQIDASNTDFKSVFRSEKFDWCINCSGASSVPDSFKNPLRDFLLNVHNVSLVLAAIKDENPSCNFIQLSSAAVYGNPTQLPIRETAILNPLSPYGIHKKQAEEICKLYHDYFQLNTYILRIFSAYGPGLKKQLLWDIAQKVKYSNSITLFGTGKESRDFINIEDIVESIELIIKNVKSKFDTFNIANGESITIEKVVDTFLQYSMYRDISIGFTGEQRNGDPLNWQADINKINLLGYKRKTSFEEGMQQYISWQKEQG